MGEAVRQVIRFGRTVDRAVAGLAIPAPDAAAFDALLGSELQHLQPYNCARYRLPIGKTQRWIDKGRLR
jgi:hypothetical protein